MTTVHAPQLLGTSDAAGLLFRRVDGDTELHMREVRSMSNTAINRIADEIATRPGTFTVLGLAPRWSNVLAGAALVRGIGDRLVIR